MISSSIALLCATFTLGAAPASGIKCEVQSAVDSEMSGLKAFSFLVPEGWKANTSFRWLPPNNMAFSSDLSVATPDLHAMVDCVEHTVLTYMSGFGQQPGKGVFIQKASDFLRFRASRLVAALPGASDLTILDEQNTELPADMLQQAGPGYGSGDSMHQRTFLHQAGYLKAKFTLNGVEMTVDLGTEVFGETSSVQIPGSTRPNSVSQVNRVGPTLTVMLESGAPARRRAEAKIIASSFQMTPEFHTYWVKMVTHAAQVQLGVNAAEQRASDLNWHENAMANFRKQMQSKSDTTHDFCNMVANQQDYRLGNGIVTLPNDYKGWWDPTSSVLMISDNPQFVPSGAGTQNYKALQAVHAGDR